MSEHKDGPTLEGLIAAAQDFQVELTNLNLDFRAELEAIPNGLADLDAATTHLKKAKDALEAATV